MRKQSVLVFAAALAFLAVSTLGSKVTPQRSLCLQRSPLGACVKCPKNAYLKRGRCFHQNIPGCVVYAPRQNKCRLFAAQVRASRQLQTITCPNQFYLIGLTCTPVSVSNCETTVLNTNACQTCKAGFYLLSPYCLPQSIKYCDAYVSLTSNTCVTCAAGYYLTTNNVCAEQKLAFCSTYAPNRNYCLTCITGYTAIKGACEIDRSINCSQYDAALNICKVCNSLFYVSYNRCFAITITNCKTSGGVSNLCVTCVDKYYVKYGYCSPQSLPYCVSYQLNVNVCLACEKGYIVISGRCQADKSVNCVNYRVDINYCYACKTTHYLLGGMCTPLSAINCQLGDGITSKCTTCMEGYTKQSDLTCILQNVANCLVHVDKKNLCQTCNSLFYVAADKSSCPAICDANCASSDGVANVCQACNPNFFFVDGKGCLPESPFCKVLDAANNGLCAECLSGYTLDAAKLCQPVVLPANCLIYDTAAGRCSVCGEGYLDLGTGAGCVANSIQNCQVYDQTTAAEAQCRLCKPGYSLLIGIHTNVNKNFCPLTTDLTKLNHPGLTSSSACSPLAYLKDGVCTPLSGGCAYGDGLTNKCLYCLTGYSLVNGACVSFTIANCAEPWANVVRCKTCATGYRLTLDGTQCLNTQLSFCTTMNSVYYKCDVCFYGYQLLADGTCRLIIESDCQGNGLYRDGVCSNCGIRYYLTPQGSCVRLEAECKNGNYLDKCLLCQTGEYYDDVIGQCVLRNNPNCQTFKLWSNDCSVCASGHVLTPDYKCTTASLPDCAVYQTNENYCLKCTLASNKEAFHGVCVFKPFCGKVEPINDQMVCTSCSKGYLFDVYGLCQVDPSAATHHFYIHSTTGMISCDAGYSLNPSLVTTDLNSYCPAVTGCKYNDLNSAQCLLCDDSNFLDGTTCKPRTDSSCATYDPHSDGCLTCQNMYFLNKDGHCQAVGNNYCLIFEANQNVCGACSNILSPNDGVCSTCVNL